jgi:hypothetical protein
VDPVVRLQALDGQWEVCGADRLVGIVPQDLQLAANEWGSDTASFTLRRDPGSVHPDLTAFTPCDVSIAGELVWSGRVRETPTKEGADPQISVQGQGWQYHLDDDVYERFYVHTRVGDWRDQRSFLTANLAVFTVVGQVSAAGGAVIGWPNGGVVAAGARVGVTLDLGENASWQAISLDFERTGGTANEQLYVRGHRVRVQRGVGVEGVRRGEGRQKRWNAAAVDERRPCYGYVVQFAGVVVGGVEVAT